MDLLREARDRGIILESGSRDMLRSVEEWEEVLERYVSRYGQDRVMRAHELMTILKEGTSIRDERRIQVEVIPRERFPARDLESNIEIKFDYPEPLTRPDAVGFRSYARDRFKKLSSVLKGTHGILATRARSIETCRNRALRNPGKAEGHFIAMIRDIRTSSKGFRIITIEDETGTLDCLLPSPKDQGKYSPELRRGYERMNRMPLVRDAVYGFKGDLVQSQNGGDVRFYPSGIYTPGGAGKTRDNGKPECRGTSGAGAMFISDVHMGSDTFMSDAWRSFMDRLNGRKLTSARDERAIGRTKYLVICGDLVDGIGIYPGQEDELCIKDIYDQYGALAREMESIPDHIDVIIIPGNHDAARPSEPQPPLRDEFARGFPGNSRFLSNPSRFTLDGVDVLAYHGKGFDDLAVEVTGLGYDNLGGMMKAMLQLGLLAPVYGGKTPISPEMEDNLTICEPPQIFATGHVHKHHLENHNGTMLINASTWQTQTKFQKTMSLEPDPGKVTFVDLGTMEPHILEFA